MHVKLAEMISADEENQLWESGVLNATTHCRMQYPMSLARSLSLRWTRESSIEIITAAT